jgi:DNA-directed RNA polymerase specialized sigma24 family protein
MRGALINDERFFGTPGMSDLELIERFKTDPEAAYLEFLERYTSVLLRMIRCFMKDADEVMEVYVGICERLCAHQYQALRRFRSDGKLTPWLSVVVANACRDRFRKTRASSVPQSVLSQLSERERLVFKYYYQEHLPHEDIAEIISRRHRVPFTALETVRAIAKINDLLSTRKRWLLLAALSANRPSLSIDEMQETGYQPASEHNFDAFDELMLHREQVDQLNAALAQLDAEDQLLLLLRFEHNRSAPQIARIMGFEEHKYVYTRLRTIVKRLRRLMGID